MLLLTLVLGFLYYQVLTIGSQSAPVRIRPCYSGQFVSAYLELACHVCLIWIGNVQCSNFKLVFRKTPLWHYLE